MLDGIRACPICGVATRESVLAEARWIDAATESRLRERSPEWRRHDGACPACVQQALLALLVQKGEGVLGRVIQDVWPLDADAAFGALPTPLRMRADPRFTGLGVTVAVVDAGFYPHDDLIKPRNRIRAWVNAATDALETRAFAPNERPFWPGSAAGTPAQWHGLMTSAALAGNGWKSHGLYRGLASEAELVLVQVRGDDGRIGSTRVARALRWVRANAARFGIHVVSVSLGASLDSPEGIDEVDAAVADLLAHNVCVVVASGNDGERSLTPPATAPDAITVGGLDDRNLFDPGARAVWHSNFGAGSDGHEKPELVAPSLWVVAPVLPDTDVAHEADALFARRAAGDASVAARIAELRLVTPHYQHVEGTSFAAPIVTGIVACMLEANDGLRATHIRELLTMACHEVSGAARERQGAGAIDAGRAVAAALAAANGMPSAPLRSPVVDGPLPSVCLLDRRAVSVRVLGSWDDWRAPGTPAMLLEPGVWRATIGPLAEGSYAYKLLIDDVRWIADPANPVRAHDGNGGWNSALIVPGQ